MGIFDAGSVSWPSGPADSKQTNYKRRAYGTVTAVGNKQFTCAGSKVLSFFNGAAVNVKRGGRYAPGAHLTSITTKNHGGGDMSEASLWEIEFQYTVYDKETLDSCATSFMIPGAQVDVKFGWNTGNSVTISSAEIFDFSWNYNVDNGSWSCTGKALGSAAGTAGGVTIPTGAGASLKDAIGEKKGFSLFAELDVRAQIGLGVKRDKDGKLTGAGVPSADGSAKVKGDFGIINAFVEAGWFSDVSNYQTMVKMSRVITDINTAISKNSGGVKYAFKSGKYYSLPLLKSADPLLMCFPSTGAAYHPSVTENKNNFSALTGAMGEVRDLWLSTQFLKQIEDDLLNKQSDKNRKGEYSANTYLSKLFGEISNLSGGVIDLAITTNPDDKKTFEIINKKYDVKYSGTSTLSLRSPNSPVKSVSMSSNMDPDMMAIAFSGGSGKYPNSMASNVFGGCSPINTPNTDDAADKLKSKIQEMGDKYDTSTSTDFKKILREYANSQLSGKKISIRYNIDLSVTVDGFSPKFGQSFSVDPMPSSVGTGTINFVVGEIEHKVDGAVFETTVVGYMMVQT